MVVPGFGFGETKSSEGSVREEEASSESGVLSEEDGGLEAGVAYECVDPTCGAI